MKKIKLLLLLCVLCLTAAGQRVRTTAVFDADTTTRPKVGFYGVGVRSGHAYLVPATGNNVRLANYSLFTGLTTNYLSKWNGSKLVNSGVFDNGTSVGIGTTPTSLFGTTLDIYGASASSIGLRSNTITAYLYNALGYFGLGTASAHDLRFETGSVTRMTITSSGNVGIGTTSPAFPLVVERPTSHTIGLLTPDIGTSGTYTGVTFGYTGTTYQKGGIYYESQDGNGRGKLHFALNGAATSANTSISDSKMVIDYSGNVGIGTASPSAKLHLQSATHTQLLIEGTSSDTYPSISIKNDATTWTIYNDGGSSDILNFYNGGSRMAITTGGNIGIGTTAPTSKLQVVGLPVYADNSAATSGGLTAGAFYRTSTGVLMVVY